MQPCVSAVCDNLIWHSDNHNRRTDHSLTLAEWYCRQRRGPMLTETGTQTQSLTASGVWCSRRLLPWLRDYKQGLTGDRTKCTHQEPTIHHIKASWETHVADRKTLKTEEERERRERNAGGGLEWVGGWLRRVFYCKKLVDVLLAKHWEQVIRCFGYWMFFGKTRRLTQMRGTPRIMSWFLRSISGTVRTFHSLELDPDL